jgi:hypothetical protein
MIEKDDILILHKIIGEELDHKIRAIVERRLDGIQERFDKLEKIDNIIRDIKSLFS